VLDGPLALHNAINPEAARIKGIDSAVAGYAEDPLAELGGAPVPQAGAAQGATRRSWPPDGG
jgi:hypothetical protein